MISIFYSTRESNKKKYREIQKSCTLKNVEVIEFVNKGIASLPQAYNKALEESKYDILVCIHDDISLEKGWDKKLLNYFNSTEYGILGVAGTTDLGDSGMWWQDRNRMVGRVYHPNKRGKWVESKYSEIYHNKVIPVVTVDGLFISMHKQRIKSTFDERFEGFHFYDVPFCVSNHLLDVEVGVITDIKIKHDSIGIPNQQWKDNREKFAELFAESLPLSIVPPIDYENVTIKLKEEPKLGIVIPSKDNFDYLERCIQSLLKTKYSNYKIYLADTGSEEIELDKIKNFLEEVNSEKEIIKLICFDFYNFSKINNKVVEYHMEKDTELVLFCNDDIEMLNDAISLMVQAHNKHKKHVGTIGCRLYYGDNTVQHGGIAMYLRKDDHLALSHKGIQSYYKAPIGKEYDVLGCTGAFLMIRKDVFFQLRGFTEETIECMEDVILNINCIVSNLKNIYIGQAVCYHYESVSRKKNPDKIANERRDFIEVLAPTVKQYIYKLKKYINVV